ncbi:patatin-like protein [Streptomyces sp. NPDC127190]|uniref:patatin-like protein n=1 Tax=unclassified Streptomyces TaxID=2593676 RepID=UPI003626EC55
MDDTSTQLAPAELRLAAVFTGGVSLAVWMGGVAREINLLTQAGADRAEDGQVRAKYRELLDLLRLDVRLDVLSGTSAGGINAACLGLANARGCDLGGLRDLWLDEGALSGLLRSPAERHPPSLLRGDEVLLAGLRTALEQLPPPHAEPRDTHVFITTTLLDGVRSTFRDDYGTAVQDTDHRGVFAFGPADLAGPDIPQALALAARASASFPVAFEPAFVPVGTAGPAGHPDMSRYLGAGPRTQFCADGGLLANRPLGPALKAVFDRPARGEVRRVLTYVVPTVRTPPLRQPAARPDDPPPMGPALVRDLDAALSQTISGDLKTLTDHNDRVTARRRREEWLVRLLPPDDETTTSAMYAQYREGWIEDHARSAAERNLARRTPGRPPPGRRPPGYGSDLDDLTHGIAAALAARVPDTLPEPDAPDLFGVLARFGQAPLDGARASVLTLLRDGSAAAGPDLRRTLDGLIARVPGAAAEHAPARPVTTVADLLELPRDERGRPDPRSADGALDEAERDLGDLPGQWARSWQRLAGVLLDARETLDPRGPAGPRLAFLVAPWGTAPPSAERAARRLFLLEMTQRTFSAAELPAPQTVELVQVSADTRTLLDARCLADDKLTGLQLHHFGAFYKRSWRANDWMWGRLDGAGWLVHILLSPARLSRLAETAGAGRNARDVVREELSRIAGGPPPEHIRPGVDRELAFLDDPARAHHHSSLPLTSLWVASALQRLIAAEELPCVAEQARLDREAGAADEAGAFERACAGRTVTPDDAARLLGLCRISEETFAGEAGTPLLTHTVVQSLTVAVNAAWAAAGRWSGLRLVLDGVRAVLRPAGTVLSARLFGDRLRRHAGPRVGAAGQ